MTDVEPGTVGVILTVDTNEKNQELLGEFLGRKGYRTREANTLDDVDAVLDSEEPDPDAALVDVSGFGPDIWDCCRRLRQSDIPHLVISPRDSPLVERKGLEHGAQAVVLKPVVARRLMDLIEGLLESP